MALYDQPATEREIAEAIGLVVMPSNNSGRVVRDLAARFPGRLASLMSPGGFRKPFMPYALDNGAFSAYRAGTPFNEAAFKAFIQQVVRSEEETQLAPLWIAVPDVVADAKATIEAWHAWKPAFRFLDWKQAFVVQDGMIRQDVPEDADIVFVGGSLEWKWSTVPAWAGWFGRRVHVGRVNSPAKLEYLEELGVGSCDGTGWFRGDPRQLKGLVRFLEGAGNMRLFEEAL